MRSLITFSFLVFLPLVGFSQEETPKNERISVNKESNNQIEVQNTEPETQTNERVSVRKKSPKKKTQKGNQINAKTSKNKEE